VSRPAEKTERASRLRAALLATSVTVALVASACGGTSRSAPEVFPSGGEAPNVANATADVRAAARAAGCDYKTMRAPSRDHVNDRNAPVKYSSNPPTSGRHFEFAARDGLYQRAPKDTELVHSLEHGRVILWAKPNLPRSQRAALRAYFEKDDWMMLLVPRRTMPYAVAMTAWNADPAPLGTGRLLGCRKLDAATWRALTAFRDDNRGNGPEAVF